MSARATVRRGSRRAESLMTDAIRVDRVLSVTADEDANVVPVLLDPPVHEGPAKVQTYEPYEQERDVAGSTVVTQRYALHIPVSVEGIAVGDYATVTAGPDEGRVFRIAGLHRKTWQTAQRLLCDEHTGGLVP